MPSRLLREGILSSERVDSLDAAAEVFYRRLMSKVDDHGLYDGRPSILRSSLYPLRVDRVREADITRWIAACEKAGVIALYAHEGKPYLQMLDTRWVARSEPKYPKHPLENGCKQPQTPAPVFVVGVGVVVEDVKGARPFDLPEWIPADTWEAYLKTRAGKKAKNEPHALGLIVKDLEAFRANGHDPVTILNNSIKGGWAGVFEPKTTATKTSTVPGKTERDPALVKIDQDNKRAVGPSLETLQKMAALRKAA